MPRRPAARPVVSTVALAAVAALSLAACGAKATGGSSAGGSIAVTASDSSCVVGTASLAAGQHTFSVKNAGDNVTEFYVYAPGDRIVGEVENIGPATSRELTVDLPAGSYALACKPGMVGNGIRNALEVTGSAAPTQAASAEEAAAVSDYRTFVTTEVQAMIDTTTPLVAAIKAGDLAKAKALYPAPRTHYERIEPVAESFSDLDGLIDERIDDVKSGEAFTGFHAIEQLLFQKQTLTGAAALGDALLANQQKLATMVPTLAFTPLTMANGAKGLMDEVASSKVTGEEERYSRLDLLDFAGNVIGAQQAYSDLRPLVLAAQPALVTTLDAQFTAMNAALGKQTVATGATGSIPGSPYKNYDALSKDEVKALATQVDALSAPLGQVAGVVKTAA